MGVVEEDNQARFLLLCSFCGFGTLEGCFEVWCVLVLNEELDLLVDDCGGIGGGIVA